MLEQLEVVAGPNADPVDIIKVKKFLRLTGDAEDDIILMMMRAARSVLEEELGRCFLTQSLCATCVMEQPLTSQIRGVLDIESLPGVAIPRAPVQTVTKVQVETAPSVFGDLSVSDYAVTIAEPTIVTLFASSYAPVSFPWWLEYQVFPRMKVFYTAGYTTVTKIPDWMILLFYRLVAYYYVERESGSGLPDVLASDVLSHRTARV